VSIKYGINSIIIQGIIFLGKKLDIQGVPKLKYDLPVTFLNEEP